MKSTSILFFMLFTTCAFADSWVQKSDFGGTARHAATAFFLNGKGYIGTGGTFMVRTSELWEYDPVSDIWTQKANIPTSGRSGSVAFALKGKGYIATGFTSSYQNDLQEYDPVSNTWTQKASLGVSGRHYAIAFATDDYGYVGTGTGSFSFNDLWQYDQATNAWTQKANFGGITRSSAVAFSLNNKGYVGTGYGAGGMSDFWEYDPGTNTWTQKASVGGGGRSDAVAFAACDKGYIATGTSTSGMMKKDLWEYDPGTNTWTQKANFGGTGRYGAIAFSDGTYGYVGTGTNIFTEYDDIWQYQPDCTVILPIELESFSATPVNNRVMISWITASEVNNDYFTLERSADLESFEVLAEVDGKGTGATSSPYEIIDESPLKGVNYYRLKQTDLDGSFSYSEVISCLLSGNESSCQINVSPNPFQSAFTITIDAVGNESMILQLFDDDGKKVLYQAISMNEEIHRCNIELPELKQGIYLLRIRCGPEEYSQKVMKMD